MFGVPLKTQPRINTKSSPLTKNLLSHLLKGNYLSETETVRRQMYKPVILEALDSCQSKDTYSFYMKTCLFLYVYYSLVMKKVMRCF